jgi:hypothetical protein
MLALKFKNKDLNKTTIKYYTITCIYYIIIRITVKNYFYYYYFTSNAISGLHIK